MLVNYQGNEAEVVEDFGTHCTLRVTSEINSFLIENVPSEDISVVEPVEPTPVQEPVEPTPGN